MWIYAATCKLLLNELESSIVSEMEQCSVIGDDFSFAAIATNNTAIARMIIREDSNGCNELF